MILQELVKYYERKLEEGDMPEPGFFKQKIRFEIIIDEKGKFIDLVDLSGGKKDNIPFKFAPVIPDRSGKNSFNQSGFLIDKADYILGFSKDVNKPNHSKTFISHLSRAYNETKSNSLNAAYTFVNSLTNFALPEKLKPIVNTPQNPLLTFRIKGSYQYIFEEDLVRKWVNENWKNEDESDLEEDEDLNLGLQDELEKSSFLGQCLISGDTNVQIARKHQKLKMGWVDEKKNTSIVNFNRDAFCSYGKLQSRNATVSVDSEYKYSTALKTLVFPESKQRIKFSKNLIMIFWSERKNELEDEFAFLLKPAEDEETKSKEKQKGKNAEDNKVIKEHFQSPFTGKNARLNHLLNDNTKFFILGLAPNAARISIRFWYSSTVGEISRNIEQHFQDLKMEIPNNDSGFISLNRILRSTALQAKLDNVNPLLAGKLITSIISGSEYPRMLLSALLIRIKAEQKINFERASLIKAILNRKGRLDEIFRNEFKFKEFKTIMDESNTNVAYRLGRLFAVMEKLQQNAIGGNKTIKDGYFASASTRPASVFARLFTLSNHHASKLGNKSIWYEKMKGEIIAPLEGNIPKTFKLEEQGMFAIGYYQQREELFKKKGENGNGGDQK
jgi:CRISPR-associated protein Csd1